MDDGYRLAKFISCATYFDFIWTSVVVVVVVVVLLLLLQVHYLKLSMYASCMTDCTVDHLEAVGLSNE